MPNLSRQTEVTVEGEAHLTAYGFTVEVYNGPTRAAYEAAYESGLLNGEHVTVTVTPRDPGPSEESTMGEALERVTQGATLADRRVYFAPGRTIVAALTEARAEGVRATWRAAADELVDSLLAGRFIPEIVDAMRQKAEAPQSLDELFTAVGKWAEEKHIVPVNQFAKIVEELGELGGAFLRVRRPKMADGIGDVLFTVIAFAHLTGFDAAQCFRDAVAEVLARKGETVGGTFIKDGDMKSE